MSTHERAELVEAIVSGKTKSIVIEHDPDPRISLRYRGQYQLVFAANFALLALGEKVPLETLQGCKYFLKLATSGQFCVDTLTLPSGSTTIPTGQWTHYMQPLLQLSPFRDALRHEPCDPFRYTETLGIARTLQTIERTAQAWSTRKSCAVLQCRQTRRAIACLFIDTAKVLVIFDPCPPAGVLGVVQSGPTLFGYHTGVPTGATDAVNCIQTIFMASASGSPAYAGAPGADVTDVFLFSAMS